MKNAANLFIIFLFMFGAGIVQADEKLEARCEKFKAALDGIFTFSVFKGYELESQILVDFRKGNGFFVGDIKGDHSQTSGVKPVYISKEECYFGFNGGTYHLPTINFTENGDVESITGNSWQMKTDDKSILLMKQ